MKELVGLALATAIEQYTQAAKQHHQALNTKIQELESKIASVDAKIDNMQSESTQVIIEGIKSDSDFVSTDLFNQQFPVLERLIINQAGLNLKSPDQKRRNVTPNKAPATDTNDDQPINDIAAAST